METIDIGKIAAAIANEKKSSRIVLYDLRKHSDLCEFMLVCSCVNDRQTNAVAEGIELALKTQVKERPSALEGKQVGQWVLMDYGSLVVHIFLDSIRDYYAIEKLWPEAPQVPLTLK